jgi:hypothetical protein
MKTNSLKIRTTIFLFLLLVSMTGLNKLFAQEFYTFQYKKDTSIKVVIRSVTPIYIVLKDGQSMECSEIQQLDSTGITFGSYGHIHFDAIKHFECRPYSKTRSFLLGAYFAAMANVGIASIWYGNYVESGPYAKMGIFYYVLTSALWATVPILLDLEFKPKRISEVEIDFRSIKHLEKH